MAHRSWRSWSLSHEHSTGKWPDVIRRAAVATGTVVGGVVTVCLIAMGAVLVIIGALISGLLE